MKDFLPFLIPITGIVMGCGIPLLAIYTDYRKRREMFTLYHQERMAAIEKGIELPPLPEAFFNDGKDGKNRSPHRDLGWGLFWLLGGLGLLVALYFNVTPSKALYALIPIGIGLHYLIYYFVVGKQEAVARATERRTGEA
jgi:hypothetical protein